MSSHGTTCPFCLKYSSVRQNGKLYIHKGNSTALISSRFLDCKASGLTWEQAKELRTRVDSGQHIIQAKVEMGVLHAS